MMLKSTIGPQPGRAFGLLPKTPWSYKITRNGVLVIMAGGQAPVGPTGVWAGGPLAPTPFSCADLRAKKPHRNFFSPAHKNRNRGQLDPPGFPPPTKPTRLY